MVLPAPVTLTKPVPSPPMPGTICAAVRMPPAVTLTVPIPPTPPEVLPMKMRWPGEIDDRSRARTAGDTSPDWLTFALRHARRESASARSRRDGCRSESPMRTADDVRRCRETTASSPGRRTDSS